MISRINFRGQPLTGNVCTTKCFGCGMPLLDATEFHPQQACDLYAITRDSDKTWRSLLATNAYEQLVPQVPA